MHDGVRGLLDMLNADGVLERARCATWFARLFARTFGVADPKP